MSVDSRTAVANHAIEIVDVVPASGSEDGGYEVRIYVEEAAPGNSTYQVTFGDADPVSATRVEDGDDVYLLATAPAHVPGIVDVEVAGTSSNGCPSNPHCGTHTDTREDGFEYLANPLITLAKACTDPDQENEQVFVLALLEDDEDPVRDEEVACGGSWEGEPEKVVPGTYTIVETLVANWELLTINCGEDDLEIDFSDEGFGSATIELEFGDEVTCTFTNQQLVPDTGEECKAAPAIAGEYLKGLNVKGKKYGEIISAIAKITGKGGTIGGHTLVAARYRCDDYASYVSATQAIALYLK